MYVTIFIVVNVLYYLYITILARHSGKHKGMVNILVGYRSQLELTTVKIR